MFFTLYSNTNELIVQNVSSKLHSFQALDHLSLWGDFIFIHRMQHCCYTIQQHSESLLDSLGIISFVYIFPTTLCSMPREIIVV